MPSTVQSNPGSAAPNLAHRRRVCRARHISRLHSALAKSKRTWEDSGMGTLLCLGGCGWLPALAATSRDGYSAGLSRRCKDADDALRVGA